MNAIIISLSHLNFNITAAIIKERVNMEIISRSYDLELNLHNTYSDNIEINDTFRKLFLMSKPNPVCLKSLFKVILEIMFE